MLHACDRNRHALESRAGGAAFRLPYDIAIEPALRLLVTRISGRVTPEEAEQAIAAAAGDPGFDPAFDDLVLGGDEADLSAFDTDYIRRFVAAFDRHILSHPRYDGAQTRTAIVLTDPGNRGVLRLLGALYETESQLAEEVQTFPTLAEAARWLGRDPDALTVYRS